MSRKARPKRRKEAFRREEWELKNYLAELARDHFDDMRDELESEGLDGNAIDAARHRILDRTEATLAAAVEAATGPRRPVTPQPARGQRENTITPSIVDQWRPLITAAHQKLQAKKPGRRIGMGAIADEAIVEAEREGLPVYSQKAVITRIMARMTWPSE